MPTVSSWVTTSSNRPASLKRLQWVDIWDSSAKSTGLSVMLNIRENSFTAQLERYGLEHLQQTPTTSNGPLAILYLSEGR